jgi:hypothetical protein
MAGVVETFNLEANGPFAIMRDLPVSDLYVTRAHNNLGVGTK